jgi:hypothetical protein
MNPTSGATLPASARRPANGESPTVSLLADRLGRLSQARLQDICAALAVAVDCPASLVR